VLRLMPHPQSRLPHLVRTRKQALGPVLGETHRRLRVSHQRAAQGDRPSLPIVVRIGRDGRRASMAGRTLL
jgi:hypothetical protein